MQNSESSRTRRFGAISRGWNSRGEHLRFCAVVFETGGDHSELRTTLLSLARQSLPPASVVVVIQPAVAGSPDPPPLADSPLSPLRVAYGNLANHLLEEAADAFAFLHAGSGWLPPRLEHDDAVLRNGGTMAVLSLPLLVHGKGEFCRVPRDPFPVTTTAEGFEWVAGEAVLGGIDGLDAGALLDCLSVRRDLLLPQLQREDPSILPALWRGLKHGGTVRFSERCLTNLVITPTLRPWPPGEPGAGT
jgi:hypothetical protein